MSLPVSVTQTQEGKHLRTRGRKGLEHVNFVCAGISQRLHTLEDGEGGECQQWSGEEKET